MGHPITAIVLISSGWEHSHVPAIQCERLDLLLKSLLNNSKGKPCRTIVVDQPSKNWSGQRCCKTIAGLYGLEYYIKPEPFDGPAAMANFAFTKCDTEMIASIQDDVYFTNGAWDYMQYVVDHNDHVPWGMLGWSIIFANALCRAGIITHKYEFYTKPEILDTVKVTPDLTKSIIEGGFTWGHPFFQKHSSGPAFVLKHSIFDMVGGYHEDIIAGDEDYGENCWWVARKWCVQFPTPPILHYEGACGWPDWLPPSSIRFQKGWLTRPHCPCEGKNRGTKSFEVMATLNWDEELLKLEFPLPGDCRDAQIIQDRIDMKRRLGKA